MVKNVLFEPFCQHRTLSADSVNWIGHFVHGCAILGKMRLKPRTPPDICRKKGDGFPPNSIFLTNYLPYIVYANDIAREDCTVESFTTFVFASSCAGSHLFAYKAVSTHVFTGLCDLQLCHVCLFIMLIRSLLVVAKFSQKHCSLLQFSAWWTSIADFLLLSLLI